MKNKYVFAEKHGDLYWFGTDKEFNEILNKDEYYFKNCSIRSHIFTEEDYEKYMIIARKYYNLIETPNKEQWEIDEMNKYFDQMLELINKNNQ